MSSPPCLASLSRLRGISSDEDGATCSLTARASGAIGHVATTVTCRTGDEGIEARISVSSAQAGLARSDLPVVIAGTAVVCLKDLASDRVEHAKEQVTRGLA